MGLDRGGEREGEEGAGGEKVIFLKKIAFCFDFRFLAVQNSRKLKQFKIRGLKVMLTLGGGGALGSKVL